jgi:hypothetical protein
MNLAELLHGAHTQLAPHHQYALQLLMQRVEKYEATLQGVAAFCPNECADCKALVGMVRERLDEQGVPWGFARLGLKEYSGETRG